MHALSSKLSLEQMRNYGIEDTTSIRSNQFLGEYARDFFHHERDAEWLGLLTASVGWSDERGMKMMKYEMETRPGDKDKIRRDLKQPDLHYVQREWVLRNLTTRQYVRSDQLQEPAFPAPDWGRQPTSQESLLPRMKRLYDALSRQMRNTPKKYVDLGTDQPLTLPIILLLLTCSTSNPPPGAKTADSPKRYLNFEDGPWSGCAFDVIPLDEHLQSKRLQPASCARPDESWMNVSKQVVADIVNLHFCIQRKKEMETEGHVYYPDAQDPVEALACWNDYWASRKDKEATSAMDQDMSAPSLDR